MDSKHIYSHIAFTIVHPFLLSVEIQIRLYIVQSESQIISVLFLILKAPITAISAFEASVDLDQAAQKVQPDLGSTLIALVKLCGQKQQ